MKSSSLSSPAGASASRGFAPETWIGLWMASYVAPLLVIDGDSAAALFLPLASAACAALFLIVRRPSRASPSMLVTIGTGLMVLAIIASYLLNAERYDWVFMSGNLVSAFLLFFVATAIASRLDIDYRKVFAVQSVLTTAMLPLIIVQGTIVWGRLLPRNTTYNHVGMIALTCVIGALGIRNKPLKLALLAVSFVTLVLLSSRAAILAAGLAVAIAGLAPLSRLPARRRGAVIVLLVSAVGAFLALSSLPGMPLSSLLADSVDGLLKINDPYRGLSSGGSGRTELWEAALDLWRSSPFFGVGFKGHQRLMPDQMLAHNAYLGLLADCGLVGVAGYGLLCLAAVLGLRGRPAAPDAWARLILVTTYLVYGFVESRAFGFGNAYSIVFVLIAFDGGKRLVKRRSQPRGDAVPLQPNPA